MRIFSLYTGWQVFGGRGQKGGKMCGCKGKKYYRATPCPKKQTTHQLSMKGTE
jgi:hypothetical protein